MAAGPLRPLAGLRAAEPGGRALPTLALLGVLAAWGCTPGTGEPAPGLPPGPPAGEPPPIQAGVAPPPGPYAPGVDVVHYDLELALPETEGWIQGRARLNVAVDRDRTSEVPLDFTGLAVEAVTVDRAPVRWALQAGKLRVPLPDGGSGPATDTVEVRVDYRGVPDDGLILGSTVHGAPAAFADNWPNRARFWFPSVDHPADKATVTFTVHAPAGWEVVANGALDGEPVPTPGGTFGPAAGPRRTWRWVTTVPIPTYTMVVGGAEMVVRTVGAGACGRAPVAAGPDGCVDVTTWAFPPDTAHVARVFRRAPAMVDLFTELFGPFPYEKMANVQSATRFGGMENASAIFYSQGALAEGRDIEGTVAHEIAHQWFGDAVTEADWHHLWLSEGFATYFGAVFYEHADGPAAFRREMEDNRQSYLGSGVTGRPVIDPAERDLFALLNANNYPKGAWVLHMLRGEVGDDAFYGAVRRFYRERLHGTALTEDFRRVVEEVSGRELGWFFEQWLERPGYPVLRATWSHDAGAGEAVVRIRQVQDPSWPVFQMPLQVEARWNGGSARAGARLSDREQIVRVPVEGPPAEVVLDPDGWVLMEARVDRGAPPAEAGPGSPGSAAGPGPIPADAADDPQERGR